MLHGLKFIPEIHDALYFAANTYTFLGYGDMLLTYDWRELSPDGYLRRIHFRLHHHSSMSWVSTAMPSPRSRPAA